MYSYVLKVKQSHMKCTNIYALNIEIEYYCVIVLSMI